MSDGQKPTIPLGKIAKNEHFSLGWNYYEERLYVLCALKAFDAKADIVTYRRHLLDLGENDHMELEIFYKLLIERWLELKYVKVIPITQQFLGGTISGTSLIDVKVSEWDIPRT